MPKRYFTRGEFERASEVSGASMSETILSGVSTCHGCVIACGRVVKLEDQEPRKGPEYETIVGFGPNLEISDLSWITQMGELCDRYGMDSISLSNVLGLIFLLFERGRIPPEMLGSRRFEWGDMRAAEELVHLTARREGLGALLAQGARSVAAHFDAPELAVEVNGLEVAYHDPRGATGMALVYATSPRGACHNQSDYFMVEIGQTMDELGIDYFPRTAGPQKSANVARHQDWRTVCNSLVLCIFSNVSPEAVLELLKHGMDFQGDLEDLMLAGERAWNLKRLINLQLGLPAGADRLPALMLHPYSDGGSAGVEVPFEEMLQAYYQARGWDPDTGRPELETLRRLGLDHLHI
jgi:aldehyde:ferredoxin oxidoreductase